MSGRGFGLIWLAGSQVGTCPTCGKTVDLFDVASGHGRWSEGTETRQRCAGGF